MRYDREGQPHLHPVTVTVTAEDARAGIVGNSRSCPVALALLRVGALDPCVGASGFSRELEQPARTGGDFVTRHWHNNPPDVADWIRRFDTDRPAAEAQLPRPWTVLL